MNRRPSDRPLSAIGLALLAGLLFTAIDAISKHLSQAFPASQVVGLRYALHVAMLFVFLRATGRVRLIGTRRLGQHVTRGGMLVCGSLFMFLSVRSQPVSQVYAVAFASPLAVAALAAWLLRERVTAGAWILIVVGFAGVLVIVRPDIAVVDPVIVYPLILAASNAGFQVMTRYMGATEHPYTAQFYPAAVGVVVFAIPALVQWHPVDAAAAAWFVAMAAVGLLGHTAMTHALMRAEAAFVSPLGYFQLVWAALVDAVVFGALPGAGTWLGASLIIGSGLLLATVAWRRGRHAARPGAGETG